MIPPLSQSLWCGLGSLLGVAAPAQILELHANLHADSQKSGPSGLRWLHEGRSGQDSSTALQLVWRAGAAVGWTTLCTPDTATQPAEQPRDGRLDGNLSIDGEQVARTACDASGRETWNVTPTAHLPKRAREFVTLLGLDRGFRGTVQIDVAALVGSLAIGGACADEKTTEISLLAGHCGVVHVKVGIDADGVSIEGASGGGLTVPALLAWQAFATAREGLGRPFTATETLVVRARALRSVDREEAARQLARMNEPGARDALLRLCRADDYTAVVAMESLARHGERQDLSALVAAARQELPGSVAIAKTALLEHFPALPPDERAGVTQLLREHLAPELRTFTRELEVPLLAGGTPEPAESGLDARRIPALPALPALVPLGIGILVILLLIRRECARAVL